MFRCCGAHCQQADHLIVPDERNQGLDAETGLHDGPIEFVPWRPTRPGLQPQPQLGVLRQLPGRSLRQGAANRQRPARYAAFGQRHDALRSEGQNDRAVDPAAVEGLGADPLRRLLDGRTGLEAGQGDGRRGALTHLRGEPLRHMPLPPLQSALANHCEQHDRAGSQRYRIYFERTGAGHDIQDDASDDRHYRQPVRGGAREALISQSVALLQSPCHAAVAGYQNPGRQEEIHRLDRVRCAGEGSHDPTSPGRGHQHDPQGDGPNASPTEFDTQVEGSEGRRRRTGQETGRDQREQQVLGRIGHQVGDLEARPIALAKPGGEHDRHCPGHDDHAVQQSGSARLLVEPADQSDYDRRHTDHRADDVTGLRDGAKRRSGTEDVRYVGDDLAHGGERQRDRQRGAEPQVLGRSPSGRLRNRDRRHCGRDRTGNVLEQEPGVVRVDELQDRRRRRNGGPHHQDGQSRHSSAIAQYRRPALGSRPTGRVSAHAPGHVRGVPEWSQPACGRKVHAVASAKCGGGPALRLAFISSIDSKSVGSRSACAFRPTGRAHFGTQAGCGRPCCKYRLRHRQLHSSIARKNRRDSVP